MAIISDISTTQIIVETLLIISEGSVYDETMCDEEYSQLQKEFIRSVSENFDKLSPRERDVLRLRFGLEDAKTRTLEDVGELFGVSRERIRLIEARALRKLGHGGKGGAAGAMVPRNPLNPIDENDVQIPIPEDSENLSDV